MNIGNVAILLTNVSLWSHYENWTPRKITVIKRGVSRLSGKTSSQRILLIKTCLSTTLYIYPTNMHH